MFEEKMPEVPLVDAEVPEQPTPESTDPVEAGEVLPQPEEQTGEPPAEQPVYRTQAEFDAAFEKRLSRERKKFERDFITNAGVAVSGEEISQAAKLWGYLSQNPQIAQKVQEVLNSHHKDAQPSQSNYFTNQLRELELREALLELRDDPVFKKHEDDIEAWTRKEGIGIKSPKDLQLAYMAWKGQNYNKAVANAELEAQRKMTKQLQTKKTAATLPAKPSKTSPPPLDYSKMTSQQILAAEGLKLRLEE